MLNYWDLGRGNINEMKQQCPKCGNWVEGKEKKSLAKRGIKKALDFIPGVSQFDSAYQLVSGESLIDQAVDKVDSKLRNIPYEFKCPNCDYSWTSAIDGEEGNLVTKEQYLFVSTWENFLENSEDIIISEESVDNYISQLEKISKKLSLQPFGLKILGEKLSGFCKIVKNNKTQVVGILNLTTNSFSDGGEFYEFDRAIEHLAMMIQDGVDIIDIGAESTKPYSTPVTAEKQLEKLLPILEYVNKNNIKTPISIDTRSSLVAEECLKLGVSIINDVSGFDYDSLMADVIAKYNAKVIIQHSKGTPENMQDKPVYENLMDEIYLGLKNKIDFAISKGIKRENIIIDPGIGFGKSRENNFEIIARIEELYGLECPVMLGISRKSLLNMKDEDNLTKDIFTTALNTLAVDKKVDFIRVHNVKLSKMLINLLG